MSLVPVRPFPLSRPLAGLLLLLLLLLSTALAVVASGSSRRALEHVRPLTAADLGEGGSLRIRGLADGIEVRIRRGEGARLPRSVRLSLRTAEERSTASRKIRFPEDGSALGIVLPRPDASVRDRDLRIVISVTAPDASLHHRVAALSTYLVEPRIQLLGDRTLFAGSRYSPRIVVRSGGAKDAPVVGARVRVALVSAEKGPEPNEVVAAEARTDESGSVNAALPIAAELKGSYRLVVRVVGEAGRAEGTFNVNVERRARILLSTDKPLYQPGQLVHIRLLARGQGNGKALGGAATRISVFDAKNNKVFQKRVHTGPQGVAAATFALASRVNTGRYRIEVEIDGTVQERTVEVKPYVLPKFKVTVETKQRWLRPGEVVKGSVSARYFFGKALAGAKVVLEASTFDVRKRTIAKLQFRLDDTGTHRFSFRVPKVLHGQPLLQGGAPLSLVARVVDTAGQTQEGRRGLTVLAKPLRITVLPEAGKIVAGVENRVYVLVTRPDGSPADGVTLRIADGSRPLRRVTDRTGVAEWSMTLEPNRSAIVKIVASLPDGTRVEHRETLVPRDHSKTAVLLRPDNPAPKVGELVGFSVQVAGAIPHVFLDLVRNGQTLRTLSAPVENGRAHFNVSMPPESAGTVLVHAYALGRDMEVWADTRPLVVRPADDLRISVEAGRQTYRPGQEATLDIRVTDGKGHPVLAALGLWVVDEAVFAVSELRPGMEKVFFLLEQEILRPKIEIHGFSIDDLVLGAGQAPPGEEGASARASAAAHRRRAARVLAAAAMPRFVHSARVDSRSEALARSRALWAKRLEERLERPREALQSWFGEHRKYPVAEKDLRLALASGGLRLGRSRDPFGVPYKLQTQGNGGAVWSAILRSAGPDATWGTADDVAADLKMQQAWAKMWSKDKLRRRRRARFGGLGGGGGGVGGGGRGFGGRGFGARDPVVAARPMAARRVRVLAKFAAPALDQPVKEGGAERREDRDASGKSASRNAPGKGSGPVGKKEQAAPPLRVRSWFPETLHVAPLLLTDGEGRARTSFRVADSITTWRMSLLASTADGRLGSKDRALKVFQDFFVDVDLPLAFTRGDTATVPVAVYNYLSEPQTVTLTYRAEGGISVRGDRRARVRLAAGEVRGVSLKIAATRVGNGRITVEARGTHLSDAVRREVRVAPDGFAVRYTRSGMMSTRGADGGKANTLGFSIPDGAIDHASALQIKLYPGMFAQVVDGLESMLRMPGGCFEQTSSMNYPNALVLQYLRRSKRSKPELEAKALRFLQAGWQRLVTFEVPGGGFSWFGQAPANRILTAYGVMEFHDMSEVMEIDEDVLARTREWLWKQQAADGSFSPDAQFLHRESWGDLQKSKVLVSAYITWSLAYSRPQRGSLEPRLQRALSWLAAHAGEAKDPYALAYLANAFAEAAADRSDARADRRLAAKMVDALSAVALREDGKIHWHTKQRTATYGSGEAADIEVSALALRAVMRAQRRLDLIEEGLEWLVGTKNAWGNWHSTQATIQVLQAMIGSLKTQVKSDPGTVEVVVNGRPVATVTYTEDDADVVRFVDATEHLRVGRNEVRLVPRGGARAMYSVTATAYLPWGDAREPKKQAFDVRVRYDRTKIEKDDTVGVEVRVKSHLRQTAKMGILDVGVPPGFTVITDRLDAAVRDGKIQRYTLAGRQIILYIPEFRARGTFTLRYDLRARFPVRASTGSAHAYEYYNPTHEGTQAPGQIVVR